MSNSGKYSSVGKIPVELTLYALLSFAFNQINIYDSEYFFWGYCNEASKFELHFTDGKLQK